MTTSPYAEGHERRRGMGAARIVALVLGCLLLVPAASFVLAGAAVGGLDGLFDRDGDGYVSTDLGLLESETAAVTVGAAEVVAADGPRWFVERFDADLRVVADTADDDDLFIGIGPSADVTRYLQGVAHDEISRLTGGGAAYQRVAGDVVPAGPPTAETFWVASATGTDDVRVTWSVTSGRWAVVLMDADGSTGVAADVTAAARTDALGPVSWALLGTGAAMLVVAVVLIVLGAAGTGTHGTGTHGTGLAAGAAGSAAGAVGGSPGTPVLVEARLDDGLSRWRWLVKWVLALPHLLVLAFLWPAFVVVTLVAGVAILFTGRYPRPLFAFTEGVLRWSWRVGYYAGSGGLGTDRYPPFTLHDDPSYPARLSVRYPERLTNALVLVKWLLVVPHLLVVGALLGSVGWVTDADPGDGIDGTTTGISLLGLLVLVAAVVLLVRGRYPLPLFDLVVGLNRWIYRVIAYAALMTDEYPPFRLDQGGQEGPVLPPSPPTGTGGTTPGPQRRPDPVPL